MKSDLQQQIANVNIDLQQQITNLDSKIISLTAEMRQGFSEAREHRQALQEDLEATMRV